MPLAADIDRLLTAQARLDAALVRAASAAGVVDTAIRDVLTDAGTCLEQSAAALADAQGMAAAYT